MGGTEGTRGAVAAQQDDILARHPAVDSEPRENYILGRIHPHRIRLNGLAMELRVGLKALSRTDTPKPFLIYGRPRSGTTLLVRLLDQVPGMRCDGELLHFGLLSPLGLLKRLPRRAGGDVKAYGVKLLSYQLMEVQRVHRPLAFFNAAIEMGYTIVHLRRETWAQTLSLTKAQATGVYFNKRRAGGDAPDSVRLDPARFAESLAWNARMLAYEDAVMAHVPHLKLQYEDDLRQADAHQGAVDKLCAALGVESAPVAAPIQRTGAASGGMSLENMEEIRAKLADYPDLRDIVQAQH